MKVRNRFECPSCPTFLASNLSWVLPLSLFLWVIVGSASATDMCEGRPQSFWCFSLFDTIFGGGVAFAVIALLLRVWPARQ
jgi:hypothetical protein